MKTIINNVKVSFYWYLSRYSNHVVGRVTLSGHQGPESLCRRLGAYSRIITERCPLLIFNATQSRISPHLSLQAHHSYWSPKLSLGTITWGGQKLYWIVLHRSCQIYSGLILPRSFHYLWTFVEGRPTSNYVGPTLWQIVGTVSPFSCPTVHAGLGNFNSFPG